MKKGIFDSKEARLKKLERWEDILLKHKEMLEYDLDMITKTLTEIKKKKEALR